MDWFQINTRLCAVKGQVKEKTTGPHIIDYERAIYPCTFVCVIIVRFWFLAVTNAL